MTVGGAVGVGNGFIRSAAAGSVSHLGTECMNALPTTVAGDVFKIVAERLLHNSLFTIYYPITRTSPGLASRVHPPHRGGHWGVGDSVDLYRYGGIFWEKGPKGVDKCGSLRYDIA